MKFTKSLVAVAIAGIAAVPMAASATTTLSGVVEVQLDGDDTDTDGDRPGTKAGDAGFSADDVLFGISAEQAMNNGLTGYGSIRADFNAFSRQATAESDSVYVGIKGGFGDLRLGETGNPGEFGQVNDILTDVGDDIDEGIGYTGSFGGATIGVAYSPERNEDIIGVGAKFAWSGLSFGVSMQDNGQFTPATEESVGIVNGEPAVIPAEPATDDGNATNIAAMVGFAAAGASIKLGYVVLGDAIDNADGTTDDETAIVAAVGYSIAGVSLGLTFDTQTESEDNQLRLDAGYDLGGGMNLSSRVNVFTDGDDGPDNGDVTDWRIKLSKSF